jgi:hypothetical protein
LPCDPTYDLPRIVNGSAGDINYYQKGVAEMATKTKSRKPAPEPVEDDDDVELEDLDTEVEEDEPAKKSTVQEVTFGVTHLIDYLAKKHKVETTPRELRSLIRKMAREDNPRVDREIVAGNRARYDWPDGIKDSEVKRIIKAVVGGEMEADKKAKLQKLKDDKAKKAAATKKTEDKASAKKGKKGKSAPEPEEIDDDEVEEVDFDEDDD